MSVRRSHIRKSPRILVVTPRNLEIWTLQTMTVSVDLVEAKKVIAELYRKLGGK